MSFHDRLVRMFRQQRSSKMRNHRAYCTAVPAGVWGRAPSPVPSRPQFGLAASRAKRSPPASPAGSWRKPIKMHFSFPFHRKFLRSTVFTQWSPSLRLRYLFRCRKVLAVKSVRCSESVDEGSALPAVFSRVNRRGKFGACPVRWRPGLAASPEILLPRRMEAPNPDPEAQASGDRRCMALLRVQLRDDLSLRRKTAVRKSAITMRPGWLAQAAFVFAALTPKDCSAKRRLCLLPASPKS
jgi:hypothetical protein